MTTKTLACPNCGSSRLEPHEKNEVTEIWRCMRCEAVIRTDELVETE